VSIFCRFRDIAGYLSKVADFDPPHLHLTPMWGATLVEFRGDLWRQKTRLPDLSCGIVYVILRLAVLVEHRVVTDGQTQGHSIYHACIASHGIPHISILCLCCSSSTHKSNTYCVAFHGNLFIDRCVADNTCSECVA